MRMLGRFSHTPIGVDIGGYFIKAAQLSGSRRRWRVGAATCFQRANPGAPVEQKEVCRLSEVLRRQGFRGQDAVVAVPPEMLLGGMLDLSSADSEAPIEQAARVELARVHGCDPQSFEMACWVLPPSPRAKDQRQVLATACRHSDADGLLDVLEGGGLNVLSLDSHARALQRACGPLLKNSTGIVGILDVGWNTGQLFVLRQGSVIYQRVLPEAGLGRLVKALAEALFLPPDELSLLLLGGGLEEEISRDGTESGEKLHDLARAHFATALDDLQTPLLYAIQQHPGTAVQGMLLVGEGASIPGLAEYLSESVEIKTRAVERSDLPECVGSLPDGCSAAGLVLAIGLAQFFW